MKKKLFSYFVLTGWNPSFDFSLKTGKLDIFIAPQITILDFFSIQTCPNKRVGFEFWKKNIIKVFHIAWQLVKEG